MGRPGSSKASAQPLAAALDAVNDCFHEAYDGAKTDAKHDRPVFVLLADVLVVFRNGERAEHRYTADGFTALKSITHAPVALYAELHREQASPEAKQRLEQLQKRVLQARLRFQEDPTRYGLSDEAVRDVRMTLQSCVTMLELALGGTTREVVDEFANAVGPALLRLTHVATHLQLDSLHACVERALEPLSPKERAGLQVVVTGDHQARQRSLGMQYFCKRLGQSESVEERVAYAEGVSDERAAFELVGTRRLDHAVASAFFGDPKRLQRDILGDSATAILDEMPVEPIE